MKSIPAETPGAQLYYTRDVTRWAVCTGGLQIFTSRQSADRRFLQTASLVGDSLASKSLVLATHGGEFRLTNAVWSRPPSLQLSVCLFDYPPIRLPFCLSACHSPVCAIIHLCTAATILSSSSSSLLPLVSNDIPEESCQSSVLHLLLKKFLLSRHQQYPLITFAIIC